MRSDGFWIETYTGKMFDMTNPNKEDIVIVDIAHALSNECRYNGHCRKFYSVAEHSVHIAGYITDVLKLPPTMGFAALMHDAAEAYTGDFPTGFKDYFPELRILEYNIQREIHDRFGIQAAYIEHKTIKEVDLRIVVDERKALMTLPQHKWAVDGLEPLNVYINCWEPTAAEKIFLLTFDKYMREVPSWVSASS